MCSGPLNGTNILKLVVNTLYSNTVEDATYYLCEPTTYQVPVTEILINEE